MQGGCADCRRTQGRCRWCDGTGLNAQLNKPGDACLYCHGTGSCALCGGSGDSGDIKDLIPDWLDRLWGRVFRRP